MVATAVTEMASATMEIAGNAENTAAAAQQSAQSSEQGKMLVNQTRHPSTTWRRKWVRPPASSAS